jgi:ribosomal protein S18 acetylase RimI-like enzyme
MSEPEIASGAASDLPAFVELLEEAGAALWARGVRQWAAGLNRAQLPELTAQVEAGELLLARAGGRLVGGCIVTPLAPRFWKDQPPGTAYLGKLAVAPSASGAGLGVRIARHAEDASRARGFSKLRLDCWDRNPRLRRYYGDLGYTELGVVKLGSYEARLFEKPL